MPRLALFLTILVLWPLDSSASGLTSLIMKFCTPMTFRDLNHRALGYGVRTSEGFQALPAATQRRYLNHVVEELEKVPEWVRKKVIYAHSGIDLVLGNVTNHPRLPRLKGVKPRGWSHGTWEMSRGAGGHRGVPAVIAIDAWVDRPNREKMASLVLHEFFHTFDSADFLNEVSSGPGFLAVHRQERGRMPAYMRDYPEEAFAEYSSWYFHSNQRRRWLRTSYPKIHDYLAEFYER